LGIVPLLAGCDFLLRLQHLDPPDAQPPLVDSDFKNFDAGPCAGTLVGYASGKGLIQVCIPEPPPKLDYELLYGFDTSGACDQVLAQADGTSVCVVTARTITISQNVDIKGPRPLVLAATDSVVLHATLNIAARAAGDKGPGSDYKNCTGGSAGASMGGGGGGGAGGSFATTGGKGGDASNGGGGGTPNYPVGTIDRIRGGCSGGDGGAGATHTGNTGAGSSSGGAVYIAAGKRIELAGNINASGGGGLGGEPILAAVPGGGGGGGGSGGMIALDAPIILASATSILFANGGGGGSGGGSDGHTNAGNDPSGATYNTAAPGGAAPVGGGAGGNGGYSSVVGKPGGGTTKTGGGGGGGVGYIVLYTPGGALPPLVFTSPAPRFNP
jgi:hypothetical protein